MSKLYVKRILIDHPKISRYYEKYALISIGTDIHGV